MVKMRQKQKKNFGIILGIVAFVIVIMFLGGFKFPLSVFQFGGSQNSVHLISEDAFSKTYEITATSTRGEFIEKNSASDGIIDAGFGETTSSDGERTLPQILPEQEFVSNILTIDGLVAIENYQSGNETTYSDVRISDAKVVCIPYLGSNIILPNTLVKDDIRGQMIGCHATGKLKAYNIYGEEILNVVFYGGTKATTTITVLKQNIECLNSQLVNCQSGQICSSSNTCIDNPSFPPTQNLSFECPLRSVPICNTNEKLVGKVDSNGCGYSVCEFIGNSCTTPGYIIQNNECVSITCGATYNSLELCEEDLVKEEPSNTTITFYIIGLILFIIFLTTIYWYSQKK